MKAKSLEVFQDLHLRTRSVDVSIRDHLLAHVKLPWRHDPAREQSVRSNALGREEDVVTLIREASDGVVESVLVLWQEDDGYRVANIVPRNVGELGISNYNRILQDFVKHVAEPAARSGGFDVSLTEPQQNLEDWLDAMAASALRRFSGAANKSTGASHPMDRERWFEFLIAAHRTRTRLDPDRLARWLAEVEGWPTDIAHALAIDYEFALGLLRKYDETCP